MSKRNGTPKKVKDDVDALIDELDNILVDHGFNELGLPTPSHSAYKMMRACILAYTTKQKVQWEKTLQL